MPDPCLSVAVEMVDQTRSMPADEAARYLLNRYDAASQDLREALMLALVGALQTTRGMLRAGPGPMASADLHCEGLVLGGAA